MSGERTVLPACTRTRSYGSLVRSPRSPVQHHGRVEHTLQPGETLQGLALKYGVTMEQIKRENRLYTNDSIFLKKSLSIPVLGELSACKVSAAGQRDGAEQLQEEEEGAEQLQEEESRDITELSPNDFLRRLDGLISQSKHAAVRGCEDAETRISALEAACCSSRTSFRRSQSLILPPRNTTVRLTRRPRGDREDREDEIFEL